VNRIHVLLALGLMATGLVLVSDVRSPRDLEWPLGLSALVVGVMWLVGRRLVDRLEGLGPSDRMEFCMVHTPARGDGGLGT